MFFLMQQARRFRMKQSKIVSSLLSNWIAKIFSFLIALFIVLAVKVLNVNDRVVTVPLDVDLPEGFVAVSLIPDTIEIVITGPDSIIYLVDPSEISASADFSSVDREGIARVPVELYYDNDIFTDDGLAVSTRPSSVRILFSPSSAV